MSYFLYIKNIVSGDSDVLINRLLKELGLTPLELSPERIVLSETPNKECLIKLKKILLSNGYFIIDNNSEKITSRLKTELKELLLNGELNLKTNLSVYLSNKMNYQYHYLSSLFSEFEKISIEKYFINLKIEKAKELISLGSFTFSDIAQRLGYSSLAHFTNQFKKVEGKTPTEFKLSLKSKK